MQQTAQRNWIFILLAIILVSPLINLPRPSNLSSIPWRVELLFSVVLACVIAFCLRKDALWRTVDRIVENAALSPFLMLLALFVAWSGLSMAWASSWTSAAHHTLVWTNYVVVFVFTVLVAASVRGRLQVIYLLSAISILLGALAIFDFLTLIDFASQEGTLRMRYAKFAELLVSCAPLLFSAAIITKKGRAFAVALSIASLAWITVMLSLSKGAFLAGVFGFVILFAAAAIFKKHLRSRTAVVAGFWLLLTVSFQFGFSYFTAIPATTDYISGKHKSGPSTSDMRIYTWKVSYEMFKAAPVAGVGADNFGLAVNEARASLARKNPDDRDSAIGEYYIFERTHNEPIQIASELGVVGLAF